ncbi:hypothetical protein CY35_02G193700 [Sphagnum magellanicum]|nr:hypothetical protein CY35_02G193700 [Sphagnum magellanicum]
MGRGQGPPSADSYIGSLISLTSKSEIRYEGILYTVDTQNSNIALQNVRSFGTEGRKKDGPQIPISDKVYDYIIFRGSDIKDLEVKSSPLQHPHVPQPATDPAIISLQSQPQYLPPSSLGAYNGGMSSAGSSSDANPPPLYSGIPPSAFRGGVPSLYPQSAGFGSWGPPPAPQQAGTGTSLATPMYWQGYYGVPSGHLTQQPQLQPMMPPPGLGGTPSGPYTATEPLAAPSVSAASIPPSVAPVSLTPPTTSALQPPVVVTLAVSSTSTSTAVSTVASPLPVPVSAPTSVTSSIQGGVSAVITPTAKNPRRVVGIYQSAHPSVQQAERGSSQGPTLSLPSSDALSTADATLSQTATTQLPRVLGPPMKAQVSNSQPPLTADQSGSEPAKLASQSIESTPAQPPQQQQVTQPLLPLPSSQHKHQPPQQQNGGYGATGGQRGRWQRNGALGNHMRRGRGGGGSGRGVGLAHPTKRFTADFDFTAMNEKFNKDEVWGELGGKGDKVGDEEDDFNDAKIESHAADVLLSNKASSESITSVLYVKDDFFDSISCDASEREGGRTERTKFSEQRKIDTETFGSFPSRSRGGYGRHGGGYRGNYFGGGYGGGGGSRSSGYGRGRGPARSTTAIS